MIAIPDSAAKKPRFSNGLRQTCLLCGKSTDFELNPESRFCRSHECTAHREWPESEHETLVTKLPDWQQQLNVKVLPPLLPDQNSDLFARWADPPSTFPRVADDFCAYDSALTEAHLPFETDFLRDRYMQHCGRPACYRSERLEYWIFHKSFNNVFVLDFSHCHWSGTHKDLRSWAIINMAQQLGIRHLAAWTAGNAGYSLAKMMRVLPPSHRARIYALYDRFDESVDKRVRSSLANVECELIPISALTKKVLTPNNIQDLVRHRAKDLPGTFNPDEYWDVTDGWDTVGMLMYRLVAAQVIRDLRPTHIVAPLGTGNLLIAILLATRDCEAAGICEKGAVKVIGAMPNEENIVRQIVRRKPTTPRYASAEVSGGVPLMPKIATTYTPLLPCIDHELSLQRLRYFEANEEMQVLAQAELRRAGVGRILSEPSSLAAFAILPSVAHALLDESPRDARILVVNSGCGLMSETEQRFLHSVC